MGKASSPRILIVLGQFQILAQSIGKDSIVANELWSELIPANTFRALIASKQLLNELFND